MKLDALLSFGLLMVFLTVQRCQGQITQSKTVRGPDQDRVYSLLIAGGTIIDGTGTSRFQADLLIANDTIAYVGIVDSSIVRFVDYLDASGQCVTPGFIDPHAHGDPLNSLSFDNFLHMGVTTVILGQDGGSPVNQMGNSASRYLKEIESEQPRINIGMMAGHGSLRRMAGIPDSRPANQSERKIMQDILNENLLDGCFGMSSGLEYVPGMYADSLEMDALAQIIGRHGGVLMSHVRSEDTDKIAQSLHELAQNNKHCRTHVSHIKVIYGKDIDQASKLLSYIDKVSEGKKPMTAEVYPYTASFTGIGIVFPSWAKTPSAFDEAKKNRGPELRQFLRDKVMQRNGPEATLFGTGPFAGRTLAEVSQASDQDYVDVLMKLGPFGASGAYFVMDQDLQDEFITHPEVAICSDGSPTMRHPRGYGSFSRVIEKYVVDTSAMELETAIYKMTGKPAEIVGLEDRGILQTGHYADILVFDPLEVKENATWADPHLLSEGFEHIIINGAQVSHSGAINDSHFGKVLRPKTDR